MEGFTALIKKYEDNRLLHGIQVARGAPKLSHMFFADDSYIYSKARVEDAHQIINMLNTFERASGQKINVDKSSVFFSRNTGQIIKQEICNALRFQEANEHTSYLGLPNSISRNKTAVLGYLKNRVIERIQGWDKKMLSKRGKEILLKTVAQAMPNYAMSMFLIPKQLCTEIENAMSKFWWRTSSNKDSGIRWMSWQRMSRKKSQGGMGFKSLFEFNVALLGKQGWRLISNENSLAARLFKARYYPHNSFLTASLGSNPSYIWRSILEAQVMLKRGAVRRVGNGNSIDIVKDPWLPNNDNPYIQTSHEALTGKSVSSLMITGQEEWDVDLVNDIFNEREANLIFTIPIKHTDEDSWYWKDDKKGMYTVKSAYNALQTDRHNHNLSDNSGFWRVIWNLKIPQKTKIFLWRALSELLPTKEQLRVRRVAVDPHCPVCNLEPETTFHCLVTCTFASQVWDVLGYDSGLQSCEDYVQWMREMIRRHTREEIAYNCMICWQLWKNRNDIVWNQRSMEPSEIVKAAELFLNQWKSAQDKSFDNYLGFMTQADGKKHWERPQRGTVKINTDAAIFEESSSYSYSMNVDVWTQKWLKLLA